MLLAGASVVELQLRIRSQVLSSGGGGGVGEVMKGDTLEINCSHELFLN